MKLLLFDIDGTLLTTDGAGRRATDNNTLFAYLWLAF